MMLGKRPGYPIKRTASMTEFTFDLNTTSIEEEPSDLFKNDPLAPAIKNQVLGHRMLAPSLSMSPRNLRRNSADFSAESSHFLRSCLLCKKNLVPGRDIYMYRGDSAFCSAECREKQMKQDERKEKCLLTASKKDSSAAKSSVIKSQFSAGLAKNNL